jgi:hypothetical protein
VHAPILVDLVLSGDQDALAGFYDGRAPSVYQYCAQICPTQQVEEAVLAAFADFLGRVRAAGADADLDDLLRKSTRSAAASRMRVAKSRDPVCRSMPELIAARANGELPHGEGPINAHLETCRSCRQTAQKLVDAEDALAQPASRQPPEEVRTAWLLIAAKGQPAVPPTPREEVQAPEPAPDPPAPPPHPQPAVPPTPREEVQAREPAGQAPAPAPDPPEPVRVRRRRGGLIGAARRVARGR